jgi:hypothetical protein
MFWFIGNAGAEKAIEVQPLTLVHSKSCSRPLLQTLLHCDVLSDQTGNFMSLVCLQPSDALLHEVTTLHIQEQSPIF